MTDDVTIQLDGNDYVVRTEGGELRLGSRVGDDLTWGEAVDVELLPAQARAALDRGDLSDEALLTALRGIVQAEVERGG